jgi:hypothetical protein
MMECDGEMPEALFPARAPLPESGFAAFRHD